MVEYHMHLSGAGRLVLGSEFGLRHKSHEKVAGVQAKGRQKIKGCFTRTKGWRRNSNSGSIFHYFVQLIYVLFYISISMRHIKVHFLYYLDLALILAPLLNVQTSMFMGLTSLLSMCQEISTTPPNGREWCD